MAKPGFLSPNPNTFVNGVASVLVPAGSEVSNVTVVKDPNGLERVEIVIKDAAPQLPEVLAAITVTRE